jgi:hypothetical protein
VTTVDRPPLDGPAGASGECAPLRRHKSRRNEAATPTTPTTPTTQELFPTRPSGGVTNSSSSWVQKIYWDKQSKGLKRGYVHFGHFALPPPSGTDMEHCIQMNKKLLSALPGRGLGPIASRTVQSTLQGLSCILHLPPGQPMHFFTCGKAAYTKAFSGCKSLFHSPIPVLLHRDKPEVTLRL